LSERWGGDLTEWNSVGPLVGNAQATVENTSSNKLTNNEALGDIRARSKSGMGSIAYHVRVGSEVHSQRKGQDLRSICGSNCSEDPPRETAKNLASSQDLDIRGEEGQEDERGQNDERAEEDSLLSENSNQVTVEEDTEEGTDTRCVTKTSLPCGSQLVSIVCSNIREVRSVLFSEGWECIEVTDEYRIVAFHDDTHGNEDGPEDCHRICLDCLPWRELMLKKSTFPSCIVEVGALHLDVEGDILKFEVIGGHHIGEVSEVLLGHCEALREDEREPIDE
jgi:hypothetical protein